MMDSLNEIDGELAGDRVYESPIIRTHRRDELAARALPVNASLSDEDQDNGGI